MNTTATRQPVDQWTILKLLEWGSNYLTTRGFDETRLHCELLLAHVLDMNRMQLYLHFDHPLTSDELARFKVLFQRRLTHEPLQYIIGDTEFLGIPLSVNSHVLIPRPETEQLVDLALRYLSENGMNQPNVLDVGTGSGNIAIAIAKKLPQASVMSIDISPEAIGVAEGNLERNEITNVMLKNVDVFAERSIDGEFDLIISNPPYISIGEHAALEVEVRDFEPRIATTDGGDGFRFIRRLGEIALTHLRPPGLLLVEIAFNQSDEAMKITRNLGLSEVEVISDFAGIPRFMKAVRSQ